MSKRARRPTTTSARIVGDYAQRRPQCDRAPASTASRSTAPTAIWSTNSCATAPTSATTNMADRSTTACASSTEVLSGRRRHRHGPGRHPLLAEHLCRRASRIRDPIALFTALAAAAGGTAGAVDRAARSRAEPSFGGGVPTEPVSPAMRPLYSGKIAAQQRLRRADARRRGSTRASPTRSPSAGRSSPTPTWSSGSRPARRSSAGDPETFYSGGAAGICRLSDARRSRSRLARGVVVRAAPKRRRDRAGERGLGRAAALVALGRVGADDRLRFILDGEDAVADREALRASGPSAPRALSFDDHFEMIGLAADHHAERDEGAKRPLRAASAIAPGSSSAPGTVSVSCLCPAASIAARAPASSMSLRCG